MVRGILVKMFLIVCTLFVLGCGPNIQFVVLRDVPENPSFAVLPIDNDLSEIGYANKIERALISSGVKVVMRPSMKVVEIEDSARQGEDGKAIGKKRTERFFEFDEIDADYIVQTYAITNQVKISRLDTREVLTVLVIYDYSHISSYEDELRRRQTIFNALQNLGALKNQNEQP